MAEKQLTLNLNHHIELILFAESEQRDSLWEIEAVEAAAFGEAPVQLLEGCSYEYVLSAGCTFSALPGVIHPSKSNPSTGRITPGIFVGTLSLHILDADLQKQFTVTLEVRSTKTSYRNDYRFMLENIAEYCTDLLLQHSSPVTQALVPDFTADPQTLYQRFAFIKSILESNEFADSVYRILTDPVTSWMENDEDIDVRRLKRIGASHLRQIVSGRNRFDLPVHHFLKAKLNSVPSRISAIRKTETVDTPENRFIKHTLNVFLNFCSEIRSHLKNKNGRAYGEASHLEGQLSEILNHSLFRQIGNPVTLPLNSPVLQRREGYREILQVWLIFDLASRLIWRGGDDVYFAGKRDVAALYEYWLFFKLLEVLKEIFDIEAKSLENLIEPTADGLGLKLKSGRHIPLKGVFKNSARNLKIEFSYNRTFAGSSKYPRQGSWSRSMRPDYTLSLWPSDFTLEEAEEQELVVHIHFDAKYRVAKFNEIFGNEDPNLDNEKVEQRNGTYKRADLLKMHAYKDAIRRTGGAYVLYPGNDQTHRMTGFHEIIPGLGAFAIRPERGDDGTNALKSFVQEIVSHLLNRASQRDRVSYRIFDIHKSKNENEVREPLPELNDALDKQRALPPADTFVLIGFRNSRHEKLIEQSGLYNFRMDSSRGSLRLSPEAAGASYLLLHSEDSTITGDIYKITELGPRIFSKEKVAEKGYSDPSHDYYIVYKIEKEISTDFKDASWDIGRLGKFSGRRNSGIPFAVSLSVLMSEKQKVI